MSISDTVRNDITAAKKLRLPWWGVLGIIIGSVPIYWLFDHFGKLNIALPVLNCLAVFGFLIALKWRLTRFPWFAITIGVLAALHIPLILFVPWTTGWVPALVIAVVDSLDLCLMLWVISVVRNLAEGRAVGKP